MDALFLETDQGRLFTLYHPPAENIPDRGDFIFIPPFGEELNRSRHMISKMARTMNQNGYGVFLPDLFGTGDSEGTYKDATWDIWKNNICAAHDWLTDKGRNNISFWAMRTGALLAADILKESPGLTDNLLLWAPVASGKNFINQFLRIKIAAELAAGRTITGKELQAELVAGKSLEIAGYDLNPALAKSLSGSILSDLMGKYRINWLDVSLTDNAVLSPASTKTVNALTAAGHDITTSAAHDPLFWTLQEPEWAPSLLHATEEIL